MGDRERAGYHSLGGNDGGQSGDHHQRDLCPLRRSSEEGVVDPGGMKNDHGALPEVVQHESRQHHREPGDADPAAAEVAHVGVERLRSRDGQHDRPHGDESRPRALKDEQQGPLG